MPGICRGPQAAAVMGGARETEIFGAGAAAECVRDDVIYLDQMPGATTAPPDRSAGAAARSHTGTARAVQGLRRRTPLIEPIGPCALARLAAHRVCAYSTGEQVVRT